MERYFLFGPFSASFPLFLSFLDSNWQIYVWNNSLLMLGFEPRISGVGSNHSANCATTTALLWKEMSIQLIAQFNTLNDSTTSYYSDLMKQKDGGKQLLIKSTTLLLSHNFSHLVFASSCDRVVTSSNPADQRVYELIWPPLKAGSSLSGGWCVPSFLSYQFHLLFLSQINWQKIH